MSLFSLRIRALSITTAIVAAVSVLAAGLPASAAITSVSLRSADVSQGVHCPAEVRFTGTVVGTPGSYVQYWFSEQIEGIGTGTDAVTLKLPPSGTLNVSLKVPVTADALAGDNSIQFVAVPLALMKREPGDTVQGPLYGSTGKQIESTTIPFEVMCKPAVVWCSTRQFSDLGITQPATSWLADYQRAHRALCAGDAATARAGFAAMLADTNKYEGTNGSAYIDYSRSYFYALLAAHDDQGARRYLTTFEDGNWKAGPGERLFWNEDYGGSFAAFIAQDGNVARDPDQQAEHKLDPHLNYALADIRAGKLDDAAREMLADPDSGDLYLLMLGNIYAQEKRWPEAFTAWVAAADIRPGFAEPEWISIQHWNISALEMMYYYRAHAPARAAPPQFSCGSPTDLATVEGLALHTTGLDATRIIDAVAAGGYARVDVESKGVYQAYFKYQNAAWIPATQGDVKTPLPDSQACRNPQFVNHPSGP